VYRQIAYKQYPAWQKSGGHDLIMLLDVPHPVPDVPYARFSGSTCKHTSSLGAPIKRPVRRERPFSSAQRTPLSLLYCIYRTKASTGIVNGRILYSVNAAAVCRLSLLFFNNKVAA
jgi:hypothetical protein